MTMKTTLLATAAFAAASFADAATTVAVMELGKGGVVRRTTSDHAKTSVSGVASFWSALHSRGRNLQHAGMTVVPDLFNKADSGLVLGLMGNGVDLASMPTVSSLVQEEGKGVVGHLEVNGSEGHALLAKAGPSKVIEAAALASSAQREAQSGLNVLSVAVDEKNAGAVDAQVASLVKSLHKQALDADTTVVLHLVVEEEEGAARRRLLSRRLDDENDEDGDEEEDDEEEDEEEDEEGEENQNGGGNQGGYYGYGYYNAYGDWVTPYKTMFQIQYFNVVLWTAIALTVVLFASVYLMMYMPLMADTLLFGESAKMMGD